jgi:hypothetical protein
MRPLVFCSKRCGRFILVICAVVFGVRLSAGQTVVANQIGAPCSGVTGIRCLSQDSVRHNCTPRHGGVVDARTLADVGGTGSTNIDPGTKPVSLLLGPYNYFFNRVTLGGWRFAASEALAEPPVRLAPAQPSPPPIPGASYSVLHPTIGMPPATCCCTALVCWARKHDGLWGQLASAATNAFYLDANLGENWRTMVFAL